MMDEKDVERIKTLIEEVLEPLLELRCEEIEGKVAASAMAFQKEIRVEVRRDHAENRTRFQNNEHLATRAVAQNTMIQKQQNRQYEATTRLEEKVDGLLSEVRLATGRKEGEAEAVARQKIVDEKKVEQRNQLIKILQWLVGILCSAGIGKWILEHSHLFKK